MSFEHRSRWCFFVNKFYALAVFGIALLPVGALAASIDISTTTLTLSPGHTSGVVRVTNHRPRPDLVSVHVFAWDQVDGVQHLTPTDDIIGLPPLFTVAPEAIQTIRIGMRGALDNAKERSYRVVIEEIVPKDLPSNEMMSVNLKLDFPVFVAPASPKLDLAWSTEKADATHVRLTAKNVGNMHVKIKTLRLSDGTTNGKSAEIPGDPVTILAGESHSWVVAASAAFKHVDALTDAGAMKADV